MNDGRLIAVSDAGYRALENGSVAWQGMYAPFPPYRGQSGDNLQWQEYILPGRTSRPEKHFV